MSWSINVMGTAAAIGETLRKQVAHELHIASEQALREHLVAAVEFAAKDMPPDTVLHVKAHGSASKTGDGTFHEFGLNVSHASAFAHHYPQPEHVDHRPQKKPAFAAKHPEPADKTGEHADAPKAGDTQH